MIPRNHVDIPHEIKLTLARDRIRRKGDARAARINQKGKFRSYNVGDYVLIKTCNLPNAEQGLTSKFLALYEGPFIITQKRGSATYVIADFNENQRGLFHQHQLRPYHGAETQAPEGEEVALQKDSREAEGDQPPHLG